MNETGFHKLEFVRPDKLPAYTRDPLFNTYSFVGYQDPTDFFEVFS